MAGRPFPRACNRRAPTFQLHQTTTHDPIPAGATYDVHGAMGPAGSRLDVGAPYGLRRLGRGDGDPRLGARPPVSGGRVDETTPSGCHVCPPGEGGGDVHRAWMAGTGTPHPHPYARYRIPGEDPVRRPPRKNRPRRQPCTFLSIPLVSGYIQRLLPRSCLQQSYESAVSCRARKESRKHSKSAVCTRGGIVSRFLNGMEWNDPAR